MLLVDRFGEFSLPGFNGTEEAVRLRRAAACCQELVAQAQKHLEADEGSVETVGWKRFLSW